MSKAAASTSRAVRGRRRGLVAALATVFAIIAGPAAAQELALAPLVDWVVVDKTSRQLHLMAGNEAVRTYRVALGGVPQGPKLSAGDLRTPEGVYTIDGRNDDSDFFLSLPRPGCGSGRAGR